METGICAVIFDMGQVLLKFTAEAMLAPFFSGEELERARRIIFDSGEWMSIDTGFVSEEETVKGWIGAMPEHEEAIRSMMADWYRRMVPVEGMTELVSELKDEGYRCYLLSNTSARFFEYVDFFPCLRMLDGYLISAVEKLSKPEREIFCTALERFDLRAEECCFVDDRQDNVEGAERCGIRGIRFENYDVSALRRELRHLGIRVRGEP